jgi:hypothetical protein
MDGRSDNLAGRPLTRKKLAFSCLGLLLLTWQRSPRCPQRSLRERSGTMCPIYTSRLRDNYNRTDIVTATRLKP